MKTEGTRSNETSPSPKTELRPQPDKPLASSYHPELVKLPRLTFWRRLFQIFMNALCRLVIRLLTRCEVRGMENFPRQGPVLVTTNHLGDTDLILGVAFAPRPVIPLAKMELYQIPVVGWLMHTYGVLWVHRGQPDLKALRYARQGLKQGEVIAVAPEGRESLTGGLEEGMGGAAYLAVLTGAPILPGTFTGTENQAVFGSLKRLRRPHITLTIGPVYHLAPSDNLHQAVEQGTEQIMRHLAAQLPLEYQGVYRNLNLSKDG